jgi:preprotein translocase subunit SecY
LRLDFFENISNFLPEVKEPERPLSFKEKVIWTAAILAIFFIMYHIIPFGAVAKESRALELLQTVLASKIGTLLTIGIGPIVLASIFLQLLIGAKIIEVDFSNARDKALFSAAQKTLAIVLSFVEAFLFVLPGFTTQTGYIGPDPQLGLPLWLLIVIVTSQIAAASILLLFLDEIATKYGIGSGISLFIAAGVSLAIVQGGIMIIVGGENIGYPTVASLLKSPTANTPKEILVSIAPIIFTIAIIVLCVYLESVVVEIPISFDRFRGFGSRFPIKLLYVSVLPVILTSALLVSINTLGASLLSGVSCSVQKPELIHYIGCTQQGYIRDGLLYFFTSFPNPIFVGGYEGYFALMSESSPIFGIPQYVHIIVYAAIYVSLCVIFGKFWVEASGMSPDDIADQFTKFGLQIPGFRRDPRVIRDMLKKYMDVIIIIGSAIVGLLAIFTDLTGALGGGTGILLTVGIIYKFYNDLEREKVFEAYPGIGKFLGK